MAHGKSIENRYTSKTKTHENLTEVEGAGIFSFFGRPKTYRKPDRAERKAMQLEKRRTARARAHANGKRTGR